MCFYYLPKVGLATLGINISLTAKQLHPWAWEVPEALYTEYVSSYGHVNEPRTNWRPLLARAVDKLLSGHGFRNCTA